MPLLALADVRQTTCHPPRALPFGIIPTRPSCFYFHHPIPVCKVWNGFSRKRMSHCAGLGASVQVGGAKTVEVSGHLPTSRPHERHCPPTPITKISPPPPRHPFP